MLDDAVLCNYAEDEPVSIFSSVSPPLFGVKYVARACFCPFCALIII